MPRLIDAEALAKKVYRAWDLWEKKGNDCFVFSDIITPMLISMPTVDAEPMRHGRWDTKYLSEDEDWSGIEHTIGRCSVCGGKVDIAGKRIPYLYCPFCGAKMDEVEDG